MTLTVDGLCEAPLALSWDELNQLCDVDDTSRLSKKVRGEGVRLGAVIDRAKPTAAATHVMVYDDDKYRACLTMDEARNAAVLAHRLDGAPLPDDLGGPIRLLVPTSDNACLSVKRVVRVSFLESAQPDTVPRPSYEIRTR